MEEVKTAVMTKLAEKKVFPTQMTLRLEDFSTLDVVGKSVTKSDAIAKVIGKSKYAADLKFPGMLHARMLLSSIANGVLKSLDTSAAEALPGVIRVATRKDIPGTNRFGIMMKDQPVLVGIGERLRKMGDPIALVAAETEEIAEQAVKLIKVEYEEMPGIFTIHDALKEGAPVLFEQFPDNIICRRKIIRGDVEKAFEQCAYIKEQVYHTHMVDHAFIEPEAAVGIMEGDVVAVYCSSQNVHYDQRDVSKNLNIGLHRTKVVQATTGGGFGGKLDMSNQVHAALLAWLTNRPVRLVYTREEHMVISGKRHPMEITMKTGIDKNGKLLAHTCTVYADSGAYCSYSPGVLTRSAVHAAGAYEVPNVHVEAYGVITNNPFAAAMRGFGVPQLVFSMDNQLDFLAEMAGISQYEIRHINALRKGSYTITGQYLESSVGVVECLEKTKALADTLFEKDAKGVGIGCMMYGCGNTGLPNPAGAFVDILDDGTVNVLTGCADIGQGSTTLLAQIVAEELGIDYEDVQVISADTSKTPDGGATSASRQTFISGNACRLAAVDAKKELLRIAAMELGVKPEQLVLKRKNVIVEEFPEKSMTFQEAIGKCRAKGVLTLGSAYFNPDTTGLDPLTGQGAPYATYAFGVHMAEVDVDKETGLVTVKKLITSSDVGRAINPKNVEGQLEGGSVISLGYALMEDVQVKAGRIINPSFATYLLPTAMDCPDIYPIIVEDPDPHGPFGAKGVGEPALIPTIAAISNAVSNYIGKRFTDLPLTPQNVLKKINEA